MIFSRLIRKIFSASFINQCKIGVGLKNSLSLELERISKCDRLKNGKTNLICSDFEFIDSESFINQYIEIFQNKILDFHSNQHSPKILDCGSNIGVSISYFKKIFPNCKIIGFEPDPIIFKILKKNITLLKTSNIELINAAIWYEDTQLQFKSNGSDGGSLMKKGDLKVRAVNLIPYLNTKVDFLKVDIEGAEHDILPKLSGYLKNVQNLFIELHVYRNSAIQIEETFQLLRENGFRYKFDSLHKINFEAFKSVSKFDTQFNIFAINENT